MVIVENRFNIVIQRVTVIKPYPSTYVRQSLGISFWDTMFGNIASHQSDQLSHIEVSSSANLCHLWLSSPSQQL